MKTRFAQLFIVAALVVSFSQRAVALPVDLSIPSGGLGPTSSDGAAQHWLELGEFSFGTGLDLPLRLSFDSDRTKGPTDFGKGSLWWRSPVFHASVLTKSAQRVSLMLPCGKVLNLYAQAQLAQGIFATVDGEWKGVFQAKNFIISREDGWELEYNAVGWLARLRTDSKRTLLWNRDAKGRLESIVESGDAKKKQVVGLRVKRDAKTGLVVGIDASTPFARRSFTFGYDTNSRLTRVTLPDDTSEAYVYGEDKAGHPQIAITERSLATFTRSWDKTSRKLRADNAWTYQIEATYQTTNPRMTRTGPNGEVESYLDDSTKSGRIEFTAADGTTTIKQHLVKGPAKGKLESVTRLLAGAKSPQVMHRATYDAKGNLSTETDALGHVTKHDYTFWGASVHSGFKTHQTTNAIGAQTTEEFDSRGNRISVINALGHKLSYFYDPQNRRTRTVSHDNTDLEVLSYNVTGRLASRTEAAGAKTTFGYDKDGNRTTTTNALGHVTRDEFDARGNRIKSTNALGHTWT